MDKHQGIQGLAPLTAAHRSRALLFLAVSVSAVFAGCSATEEAVEPPPIVLVITPAETDSPAAYRAASASAAEDLALVASPRRAKSGATQAAAVRHAALPGSGGAEARAKALSALLLEASRDRMVRSILVVPAPAGSADAFRELRSRRRDIVLIAAEPSDAKLGIEAAADLVVELDRLYRPYLAVNSAKAAGSKRFVEVAAFGAAGEARSRESAVLRAACAEFGIAYRRATAKLPDTDFGVLGELDRDTALYCADSALAGAVAEAALVTGAAVVDGGPESLAAWRSALAPGLPDDFAKADAAGRLKRIEKAALGFVGPGRIAVWTCGYAAESVLGLADFARLLAAGKARSDDIKALVAALKNRSPGSAWIAAYDVDPETGVKAAGHVLVRQDPYVFGRGYEQSAFATVPPSYLRIGSSAR